MTTVAVIEDNNTMRKMLAELIDGTPGHSCVCACSTSKEALVVVPKHKPDVALMDIHLPDESGIVCTARLTGRMPELKVIMVTATRKLTSSFKRSRPALAGIFSSVSARRKSSRPSPKCAPEERR